LEPDYGFVGRRFDQRITDLWTLASDDPDTALRIAYGMQAWLQNQHMTGELASQRQYFLNQIHDFIAFMRS
jgi:hypothetical protein